MAPRSSATLIAELESAKRTWTQLIDCLQALGDPSLPWGELPRNFDELERRGSRTELLRGIQEGLSDLLEMSRDWPEERVRAADDYLALKGGRTLSQVRVALWGQLPKLLARKRLRNDFEYRLLMERLNDVSPGSLSDEERTIAERLVIAYERRRR